MAPSSLKSTLSSLIGAWLQFHNLTYCKIITQRLGTPYRWVHIAFHLEEWVKIWKRGSLRMKGKSCLKTWSHTEMYMTWDSIWQPVYIHASFRNGDTLWECLARHLGCCVNTTDTKRMATVSLFNLISWDPDINLVQQELKCHIGQVRDKTGQVGQDTSKGSCVSK